MRVTLRDALLLLAAALLAARASAFAGGETRWYWDAITGLLTACVLGLALERVRAARMPDFKALYEQAPCGQHSVDRDGMVVLINDTELRWLGYERAEVVGKKHITELMAPESHETFRRVFARLVEGEPQTEVEARLRRKDGSTFAVLVSATAIRDARGRFVMGRSVLVDHTRLRQTQETLRNVLTASPMAVRVAALSDNRILFMNQAFCQLVHKPEPEARGMDISRNYVNPNDLPDIRRTLQQTGLVQNRLVELHLPDAPEVPHVWALCSYMLIDYEGKRAVLAWLYDVTPLQEARVAAEAANRDKEAILSIHNVGFAILSGRTIRWTNSAAARLLGHERDAIAGRDTRMFYADDASYLQFAQRAGPVLSAGDTFHGQQRWCCADGTLRWFDISGARLPSDPTAALWSFVDIDAIKRNEVELREAKERAEAASQAKSDFLANMSHEIRTPLSAMLGLAHLLERAGLPRDQHARVHKISVAGQALLSLINDVLDLAKVEAGELSLERAPFSLAKLLDELYTLQIGVADAKGLSLRVGELPLGVPDVVLGDAARLRQILLNLLNNALKFTDRGVVELVVERRDQRDQEQGLRLGFVISDTGPGIAPEALPRLFNRFVQADSSHTRRHGGSGLGLSIVQQLVHLMGGEVWVKTEPGVGSRFGVEVPFTPASEIERDSLQQRFGPLELVLADDDPVARAGLAALGRGFGWRVDEVSDGLQLVERVMARMAAGDPPDCVVIDWRMPELDGLQCLQRLAALLGQRRLPGIVVITAHEVSELKRSPHAELVDRLLVKPIDSSQLFNQVNEAVVARGGRRDRVLQASVVRHEQVAWLTGVRVLLVDDSETNLEVASELLSSEGALVSTANNGASALAWLKDPGHLVDIVLMDVQMPEMDGNAAVRELRKDQRFADLPVIALTAGALLSEQKRALEAGMNDLLSKPFDPEQLVRLVRRHVERARGASLSAGLRQPQLGGHEADGGWPELPGIDGADARSRLAGNVELFKHSVRRLLDEHAALAIGHPAPTQHAAREALAARLHKLAGAAGLLGARELHLLAKAIEQGLRADCSPAGGSEAALNEQLGQLAAQLTALTRAALWSAAAEPLATSTGVSALPECLSELRAQIARHDLDALATFAAHGAALRGGLSADDYRVLERALEALDFEAALQALDCAERSA